MVHDPTAVEPRCRLQAEDSEEFGAPIYPETAVAEAIREMTEAHLRQTGGTVSAKPIVLRAEYAFCPNLTIIDTPGFILKVQAPCMLGLSPAPLVDVMHVLTSIFFLHRQSRGRARAPPTTSWRW
jgi:hypothetical protein